jgi:hypothetical protein
MCALSAGKRPKSARSKKVQDKGPTAVLAVCHPQSPAMRVFSGVSKPQAVSGVLKKSDRYINKKVSVCKPLRRY